MSSFTGTLRAVAAIALADFRQRARSHSFLIILALTVLASWHLVPPAGATAAPIRIGGFRALNTAAGIGASVALLCALWLFFAGFYLVGNTIRRDMATGVGEILATTRVGKGAYLFGKALSNLAVLFAILVVVSLTLVLLLFVKGEAGESGVGGGLGALLLPLWLLVPPSLTLVAALAVAAEIHLRRGRMLVHAAHFVLWIGFMTFPFAVFQNASPSSAGSQISDLLALGTVATAFEADLPTVASAGEPPTQQVTFPFPETTRTFEFRGFRNPLPAWLWRFVWVGIAALLVTLAAISFHRFDPERAGPAHRPRPGPAETLAAPVSRWALADLAPGSPLLTRLGTELQLMLHGRSRRWWLVSAGLLLASALAPLPAAHRFLLPVLWLWQLPVLAPLGAREIVARTSEIVFATPRPLTRQLPAAFAAGAALLIALGLPVAVRELAAARPLAALGVVGGALFLTGLALACGTWTNSTRLFEMLLPLLVYGAHKGMPPLDFTGANASPAVGLWLGAGLFLGLFGLAGRAKQVRSC